MVSRMRYRRNQRRLRGGGVLDDMKQSVTVVSDKMASWYKALKCSAMGTCPEEDEAMTAVSPPPPSFNMDASTIPDNASVLDKPNQDEIPVPQEPTDVPVFPTLPPPPSTTEPPSMMPLVPPADSDHLQAPPITLSSNFPTSGGTRRRRRRQHGRGRTRRGSSRGRGSSSRGRTKKRRRHV